MHQNGEGTHFKNSDVVGVGHATVSSPASPPGCGGGVTPAVLHKVRKIKGIIAEKGGRERGIKGTRD